MSTKELKKFFCILYPNSSLVILMAIYSSARESKLDMSVMKFIIALDF